MKDNVMEIDGIKCLVNDTSSLEAWLVMHGFRRVLCGGKDFPMKKGTMVHVASCGLMQKEVDFIEEMSASGGCPSVGEFMSQSGVIGVTDFEVVESTNLPGWDGSPNPVVLSNPRWCIDGKLVPVPADVFLGDGGSADRRRGKLSGRRRGNRR